MSEQTGNEAAENAGTITPANIFDKVAIFFFSLVLVLGTLALTAVLTGATAARYLFHVNFYGFDEIAVLLAFWLYFAGSAYGAFNRTHITVSVVDSYVKEGRFKRVLMFLRHLCTVIACGFFTYYAYRAFEFQLLGPLGDFRFQAMTQIWRIPLWVSFLAILVGFVFMQIYFTRDLILSVKELFRPDAPSTQQEPLQGEN
jgi:TRAP-type C4-dicarboxylate transport system permease small subunit